MKKLILCSVLLLAVSLYSFAQEDMNREPTEKNGAYYIKKSKGQQLFAAGFLFAAAVPQFIDVLSMDFEHNPGENATGNNNTTTVITAVCVAAAAGWLIASQVNKRKGRMMMSSQKLSLGLPHHSRKAITGITLAIPLGK